MESPLSFTIEKGVNGPRILLVDNEVGMLEVCSDALSQGLESLRLEAVAHPRMALRVLELELEASSEQPPRAGRTTGLDLIVSNMQMPGMTGMRLLERIKALDPGLPVMIVTGYPMAETAARARSLGAIDYLTKPFSPEEFVARVRAAIGAAAGKDDEPPRST